MDLGLAGRRAVVTGGTGGIGGPIAAALLGEGAAVAITARSLERGQAMATELERRTGVKIAVLRCDTSDEESVAEMTTAAEAQMGGIDILVNCAAGTSHGQPVPSFEEVSGQGILDEVDVKVVGYLRCARALAPGMRARQWGRIVNIGGTAAFTTGAIANSIRNVAVAAVTKNLADELGRDGVTVNTIHPAITRTPRAVAMLEALSKRWRVPVREVERRMTYASSLPRMLAPSEVAAVVAFVASEQAGCINGEALVCGGGARGTIRY